MANPMFSVTRSAKKFIRSKRWPQTGLRQSRAILGMTPVNNAIVPAVSSNPYRG